VETKKRKTPAKSKTPFATELVNRSNRPIIIGREPNGEFWAVAPGSEIQMVFPDDSDLQSIDIDDLGSITFWDWSWELRLFHHGFELTAWGDDRGLPEEIVIDESARMADLAKLAAYLDAPKSIDAIMTAAILYTLGEQRYLPAKDAASRYLADEDKRIQRAAKVALNFINGRPPLTDVP
jgi:hypothetical protein